MKSFFLVLTILHVFEASNLGLAVPNPKCPQISDLPLVRCSRPQCFIDQDCKQMGESYACCNLDRCTRKCINVDDSSNEVAGSCINKVFPMKTSLKCRSSCEFDRDCSQDKYPQKCCFDNSGCKSCTENFIPNVPIKIEGF
ncbi:hypothetical protein BpHYR1_004782 [Brachionus plicatilis]|uniref:WAP domain-containing protein n=1 Tax=Brachionus plicatilis TaxID=10195 RepID=A0A3M7T8N5_BRAPC|nr:hypothetical protein BpHYR1_004782 [Brachionus plicatilis]